MEGTVTKNMSIFLRFLRRKTTIRISSFWKNIACKPHSRASNYTSAHETQGTLRDKGGSHVSRILFDARFVKPLLAGRFLTDRFASRLSFATVSANDAQMLPVISVLKNSTLCLRFSLQVPCICRNQLDP